MTAQTIETPARVTTWTMPANLTDAEELAYRRGYSRGVRAYDKANGGAPTVTNPKPWAEMSKAARAMTARSLAGTMVAHHEERHPAAHKAGMSAVRSWVSGVTPRARRLAFCTR